ncbi:MAG: 4Fe-4S cluster-binding domain-containing protein [Candidatus Poseidoniaceae archaeon]|nr:4Fe-4S cluster-binding domain-containing protein [Candidatus Poseidoniaceae archaeon]
MVTSLPMASEIPPAEAGEAEGCVQCQIGSKLVLFVTGKCHWGCDYCPLSENRRESPDMFANERRCSSWEDVIEEGKAMRATGTGITGGDPMLDMEKSLEAVKQLKAAFGKEHHIHLYTSIPFAADRAADFGAAGLDEIRFHLLDGTTTKYRETMQACSDAGIFVGVELPCEPDQEERLFKLLDDLEQAPVHFLNLNELEITVGNQENMDVRGFNLSGGITAAAEGSAELAIRIKEASKDYNFHVKFCTSHYKDAGQLRNRFRRRGEATLRAYEVLSDDDTILFGAIPTSLEDASDDIEELQQELDIADGWIRYDAKSQRIELPLSLAEELSEVLSVPVLMVEVHPTHERLEVGVVYLNEIR